MSPDQDFWKGEYLCKLKIGKNYLDETQNTSQLLIELYKILLLIRNVIEKLVSEL